MRLIAYKTQIEQGKVKIMESTGQSIVSDNLENLFAFLLEPYEDTIRVCWDMDKAVAPLIRLMGETKATKLHQTRKLHLSPFNLFYVPEKIFMVKHIPTPHETCKLYHLAQYFPDLDEPQTVGDILAMGGYLVSELMKMNLKPARLTSPIAIYEDSVLKHLDLPTWKDMPKGACEYAWECSGRLWIESYQIGYWG